MATQLVMKKV